MYQVDEASINANAALANTNNPDDQVKIENLYNSFKKGKISIKLMISPGDICAVSKNTKSNFCFNLDKII